LRFCPPRSSLHHLFLLLVDVLAAAWLAESLSTTCPARRSLQCMFLSLVDILPAAQLAALHDYFSM
jgi:hypothetical protein